MSCWIGFGNEPAWEPGVLTRLEERACWLRKVCCLDQQVQCLEQAAFFCRMARQSDNLLHLPCLQVPLAATSSAVVRGEQEAAASTGAEQDAAAGARTRGASALLAVPRAEADTALLRRSPRGKPAVQHGTLRQPAEADTALLRRSSRVKPAVQLGTLRQPEEADTTYCEGLLELSPLSSVEHCVNLKKLNLNEPQLAL